MPSISTTLITLFIAAASVSAQRGQGNGNNGGNKGGNNGSGTATGSADSATSTCLVSSVIQTNAKSDGLTGGSIEAGQSASITSSNNFINFCAGAKITNGEQVKNGSCNPTPMGFIAASNKQPSSKFEFPKNLDTINANEDFTVKMKINNIQTGTFVNPQTSYYLAPQQVNGDGIIIGHTHITIEAIDSLTSTTLTDPTKFAFFKGVNTKAVNGVVTANVTGGLPPGTYRMASINAAANHQPVLTAVAQRGSNDDMVYFTVKDNGGGNGNNGAKGGNGGAAANTGNTGTKGNTGAQGSTGNGGKTSNGSASTGRGNTGSAASGNADANKSGNTGATSNGSGAASTGNTASTSGSGIKKVCKRRLGSAQKPSMAAM